MDELLISFEQKEIQIKVFKSKKNKRIYYIDDNRNILNDNLYFISEVEALKKFNSIIERINNDVKN